MKKAIPTTYDGIQFRSKLEASWYVFFCRLGFYPVYEPQGFSVCVGGWHEPYLPDFYLPELKSYVEIKPLLDRYDARDKKSMSLAYILGYSDPTIIILGSPLRYFAVQVCDRHKGNPAGFEIEFSNSRQPGVIVQVDDWWLDDCYPDETPAGHRIDWTDPRYGMVRTIYSGGCKDAVFAWNAVRWNPSK